MDELVGRVGATLREKLGVVAPVSPAEAAAVSASMPGNPEAARWYSEGLASLQVFDAATARTLLEKSCGRRARLCAGSFCFGGGLNFLG